MRAGGTVPTQLRSCRLQRSLAPEKGRSGDDPIRHWGLGETRRSRVRCPLIRRSGDLIRPYDGKVHDIDVFVGPWSELKEGMPADQPDDRALPLDGVARDVAATAHP